MLKRWVWSFCLIFSFNISAQVFIPVEEGLTLSTTEDSAGPSLDVPGTKAKGEESSNPELSALTKTPQRGLQVAGRVVGVRQRNGVSEVILEGQRLPVVIPEGDHHNRILAAAVEARKESKSLSFVIDPNSRQIQSPGAWSSAGSKSSLENSPKSKEPTQ